MHPPELRASSLPARGFTLIELLVSLTVLAVIVLLISQLVSSATSITVGNRQRLDADSQARLVFDRMAFDIAKMLKRPDVDYIFAKISGSKDPNAPSGTTVPGANDKLFFFSEAPAFFDGDVNKPATRSSVALIGYRINGAFQLERLGKTLTWESATPGVTPGGIMFLTANATTGANPDPGSTLTGNWLTTVGSPTDSPPYSPPLDDGDYHVLADQGVRLDCFQLTNGSYSPIPVTPVTSPAVLQNKLNATVGPTATDDTLKGYAVGSRWYDMLNGRPFVCVNSMASAAVWNPLGIQDVRAIVVALVILDATSEKVVPVVSRTVNGQPRLVPNLDALVGLFSDANIQDILTPGSASADLTVPSFAPVASASTSRLMAEAWGNRMKQADFVIASGVPKPAAAQVRVYQRSFS